MTRHAREAISLAGATALGELALYALSISAWSPDAVLLCAFLVGPALFLALVGWRRREHPARARVLFAVATIIAVGGLGAFGYAFYRANTDPQFRPVMYGVIVPLVQWAIVGAVWLYLVVQEARERRAAR